MSLRRYLRRGSTTEVSNRGLYMAEIEANSRRRKRDRGIGGGQRLIMIATYHQVEMTWGYTRDIHRICEILPCCLE